MTLLEVAGRLLKGSGLAQQPPGDNSSTKPRILIAKVNDPSSITSPGPYATQNPNSEVMVGSDFGEPRAQSAHVTSSWAKIRPLSDIRELTEPSLADTIPRKLLSEANLRSLSRPDVSWKPSFVSHTRPSIDVRFVENQEPEKRNSFENSGIQYARGRSSRSPSPKPADNQSITSIYSIPPGSVPPRSSSQTRNRGESRSCPPDQRPSVQATQRIACKASLSTIHMAEQLPPRGGGLTVPRRGHSQSPLREVAARLDPISHDVHRRIPSRTFIREPVSKDILDFPSHRHPRIELGLDLSAGIFVGGGSIEGTAQIRVDDAERIRHRRTLDIARISIDLLSLEEMNGNRRCVFLNLANELIDEQNPPPTNMVDSQEPIGSEECFWHLMPSLTNLAFNLSLPLNVGPPPFHSKNARIRYVLCVSLLIRDQGKQYIVRTSEEVTVLSVYDPEKALMSLPSPLTACDEWIHPRDNTIEIVRVTAGLHRQVWVSGTSIYVDVHIANNSRKTIKKIDLQLERDILCYKHAAAWTIEKSAGQARIFHSNERSILSRTTIKQGTAGWHGVPAHQTHIRTCDLEVPRGHATVKCGSFYLVGVLRNEAKLPGKYFEVRYFLNVIVGSAHTKLVTVQLPIVLIHMNSLDVVPNSVAQVAVAIEEKRSHHRSHSPNQRPNRHLSKSVQGRAFAAPRMQSLEQIRARTKDLQDLGQVLDRSPRKYPTLHQNTPTNNFDYHTPPSNRKARIVDEDEAAALQIRLRRGRSNATMSSHQNLNRDSSIRSKGGTNSALGFREAEVREDMELAGLDGVDDAPFKSRLERSRGRQYRFSKKKSGDRWRGVANVGVGWLKGRDTGEGKSEEFGGREEWF